MCTNIASNIAPQRVCKGMEIFSSSFEIAGYFEFFIGASNLRKLKLKS